VCSTVLIAVAKLPNSAASFSSTRMPSARAIA
jgi:hypothetical protein